ncbi:MAG: hypothetical protein HFE76_15335 [Firmicutes bacterium]|nr:hypothetical protein [Bacillota bacterium]
MLLSLKTKIHFEYEDDYKTGMAVVRISSLIYDYTSGYPFLVSRICNLIDERIQGIREYPDRRSAWAEDCVREAVKLLLAEPNALFGSLLNKLEDYPELNEMLRDLLLKRKEIPYVMGIHSIEMALLLGFVKKEQNTVVIANRIFETLLYNLFLASPYLDYYHLKRGYTVSFSFNKNKRIGRKPE